MAQNQGKKLQTAEKLLKQGKVDGALVQLRQLAESGPSDLLTLNRIGDLLARQGRTGEAIGYYLQIANQFLDAGYVPKAIAIHKKILRLDPSSVQSFIQLGELYMEQKLPAEARRYLLAAAEQYLHHKDFAGAREVYQQLVAIQPDNALHRARLAEAMAAEGDVARAGEELVTLATYLLGSDQAEEAEKTFRRAAELLPGRPEPTLGICNALQKQDRTDDALGLLEQALNDGSADATLLGELVFCYELAGRGDDAAAILGGERAVELPDSCVRRLFLLHVESAGPESAWTRVNPVIQAWSEGGDPERAIGFIEQLADSGPGCDLSAMARLDGLLQGAGDTSRRVANLERLIQAYRAHSRDADADEAISVLQEIAPQSQWAQQAATPAEPSAPETPAPAAAVATESPAIAPRAPVAPEPVELPAELEAPAVPLTRSDEEFVTGRLTQAEILEKYTLNEQAIEQVEEATARFPGHVEAQERRVALVRIDSDAECLSEALVGLAVALRAAGNLEGARMTAAEADHLGALGADTREQLERISLLEPPKGAELVETRHAVEVEPEPTVPAASEREPAVISASEPEPAATPVTSSDIVIDFDAMDEAEAPAPAVADSSPAAGSKPAGQEMLDEVAFYLEHGMLSEARQRLEALRGLGYGGEKLERLEARAAEVPQAEPVDAVSTPQEAPEVASDSVAVDDDLTAIAAALEQELLDEDSGPLVPDAGNEQSLDEVFAAFKDHVDREVDADDHRTHYDLGIGYKEMGLVQEAIAEFEIAIQAPELAREAGIMVAHCHREAGRPDEAAAIYRRAIESADGDTDTVLALRYELAEALVESGDAAGALDELRDVQRLNPEYRDVQTRVAELEARSTV